MTKNHNQPNKGLAIEWTKHLKGEDQEEFERLVRNSTQVLGRLRDILDERLEGIAKSEAKIDDYDSPSWSHKQAHRNGQFAEIKRLRDLLNFY